MNSANCCQNRATRSRRIFELSQWIIPSAMLAVIPKCPVCVAGYAMLWTGVGISLSAARTVWTLLIVSCIFALVWLMAREVRSYLRAARPDVIRKENKQ